MSDFEASGLLMERLRSYANIRGEAVYGDAAAEIERLRSRLAEATELLDRAEDDLSEWERIHGDDPHTTRLRLEIAGFRENGHDQ